MLVRVLLSSGLDGKRRLAVDLPKSRTVQSSDYPGGASTQWGEKLGPCEGGAAWDQTETSEVRIRR